MTRRRGLLARFLSSSFGTLVVALLAALLVRSLAFEPFSIPSGSMKPNLLVGDYLFVSKYSYGYSRHSFPFGIVPLRDRVLDGPVERGDIAVFKFPPNPDTDYIKRIVGLPGDRIQVVDEILHVNGEPVGREPLGEARDTDRHGVAHTFRVYRDTLPGGASWRVYESTPDGPLDNTSVYEVPEGHYFAMGDNRDHSSDSRILGSVGYIPAENLVGRAEILFFSVNGSARIWEVWRWPWAVRYGRLGALL